jgi:two-component system nitrate/nitrite response regulator NarL
MIAPTPHEPIRVMVVDRDRLVREGLRVLMLGNPVLQLVAEADKASDAVIVAKSEQPDVILLELYLGTERGLDILPTLLSTSAKSRVLVMTHVIDPEEHRKAMILGAIGVVQKDVGSEVLFKAIEKVHAGEIWFDRSKMGGVLKDILENGNRTKFDPVATKIATITRREHEVIALVSEGLKNREVGERLFISETTVRHHLTSVFEKLKVSNRLELIIFAFSEGLASLPEKEKPHTNGHSKNSGKLELASTF